MRGYTILILALASFAAPLSAQSTGPTATVSLTSNINPAVYGVAVTFTVKVTGTSGYPTPTGTVLLIDSSTGGAFQEIILPLDSNGSLQVPFPQPTAVANYTVPISYNLSGGVHNISAVYTGDLVYSYTAAQILTQTIQKVPTRLVLLTSGDSAGGTSVTATVAAIGSVPCPSVTGGFPMLDGSPSGTVEFFNGGLSLGAVALTQSNMPGCVSSVSISISQVNGYIAATYSGDNNYSVSTFTNAVGSTNPALPSAVHLSALPSSPVLTDTITFTATIDVGNAAVQPTGTVQFFLDNVALLGSATVTDGKASVTSKLSGGAHNILANYSGDSNFDTSDGSMGIYVNKLPVTVGMTASPTSAAYGQAVTLSAQVKGQSVTGVAALTGTVQFVRGCLCGLFNGFVAQAVIGTATVSGGVATLTLSTLPPGALLLAANYGGDTNYATAGSSQVALTVSAVPTTTTWTSLVTDPKTGNFVATAAVQPAYTGVPTGTIKVLDATAGTVLGTATLASSGTASVTLSTMPSSIVAAYSGDSNYAASQSTAASFLTIADAAGYGTSAVAADEIVSIFGTGLAGQTVSGSPVQLTDSAGKNPVPALLLVSATQINMVMPSSIATGAATVTISSVSGPTFSRGITVAPVAPGLFAANGGGTGVAAAQIIRVHTDGTQVVQNVAAADSTGKWTTSPISFGGDSLYLVLYGTGIRHRSDNANVTCTIGKTALPVQYSGAQGGFAGLDQINVALPASLAGAGTVNVVVTADGKASNTVTLAFQ